MQSIMKRRPIWTTFGGNITRTTDWMPLNERSNLLPVTPVHYSTVDIRGSRTRIQRSPDPPARPLPVPRTVVDPFHPCHIMDRSLASPMPLMNWMLLLLRPSTCHSPKFPRQRHCRTFQITMMRPTTCHPIRHAVKRPPPLPAAVVSGAYRPRPFPI